MIIHSQFCPFPLLSVGRINIHLKQSGSTNQSVQYLDAWQAPELQELML